MSQEQGTKMKQRYLDFLTEFDEVFALIYLVKNCGIIRIELMDENNQLRMHVLNW